MIDWLKWCFHVHRWEYRNPYDRTCSVCKQHEVEHCLPGKWSLGWWEVFRQGSLSNAKEE